MNLSELGEFGLIERLKRRIGNPPPHVVVGIGDDAAALDIGNGRLCLITTDALLQGIHFDLSFVTPYEAGWRTMAASLSDIAAMGGEPLGATVAMCLPRDTAVEDVDEICEGMKAVADPFGCPIVGGDTTGSTSGIVLTITVVGRVEADRLIRRSGAQVGDILCVTGDLGASRAGLSVLRRYGRSYPDRFAPAVRRHLLPFPRVSFSRLLGETVRPHAAIDISDGLSSEVGHVCAASQTGAVIRASHIPVAPSTAEVAGEEGVPPVDFALTGGEDFELLIALDPSDFDKAASVSSHLSLPFSPIGEVLPAGEGISTSGADGLRKRLSSRGYQHF